jgi:hypothetical protein
MEPVVMRDSAVSMMVVGTSRVDQPSSARGPSCWPGPGLDVLLPDINKAVTCGVGPPIHDLALAFRAA